METKLAQNCVKMGSDLDMGKGAQRPSVMSVAPSRCSRSKSSNRFASFAHSTPLPDSCLGFSGLRSEQ
jgi:hypothetical protein